MTTSYATAEPVTSSGMTTSPGKQPLPKRQLSTLFNSTEADAKRRHVPSFPAADLSLLYASVDSISSMGSLDLWKSADLTGLFASSDGIKVAAAPKSTFASIDAAVGLLGPQVFASIDPLPLKSLDLVVPPAAAASSKTPDVGIYQSREWLPFYSASHTDDIAYGAEMFNTSEMTPRKKRKTKWDDAYLSALRVPEAQQVSQVPKETKPKPQAKPTKAKKVSKKGDPKDKVYLEPLPTDIISGRGGKSNAWPGNRRYRELIEQNKEAYNEGAKYEKTIMSQEVVDVLLAEGRRFLKLEEGPGPHNGDYYLMTKNQARKKAGQALREENTPESRKKKREFYASKRRNE